VGFAEALLASTKKETSPKKEVSRFALAADELWEASQKGDKKAFVTALGAVIDIKNAEK